jgi:hypothetical protein
MGQIGQSTRPALSGFVPIPAPFRPRVSFDYNTSMRTVTNKTTRPLTVPLPRGKKLHLGPLKSGQITTEAADYAVIKTLVEAGEIEISEERTGSSGVAGRGAAGRGAAGHAHGANNRRSGDR